MNKKYLKYNLIGAALCAIVLMASITVPSLLNQKISQTTRKDESAKNSNIITKNYGEGAVNKTGITWPNDLLTALNTTAIQWTTSTKAPPSQGRTLATFDSEGFIWANGLTQFTDYDWSNFVVKYEDALIKIPVDGQIYRDGLYLDTEEFLHTRFRLLEKSEAFNSAGFWSTKEEPFAKFSSFSERIDRGSDFMPIYNDFAYRTAADSLIFHNMLKKSIYLSAKHFSNSFSIVEVEKFDWTYFKDYNSQGVANKTYIQSLQPFNTELKPLSINETLFDKGKQVTKQNLDIANLVTINAKDLPLNILNTSMTANINPDLGSIEFILNPKQVFVNNEIVAYTGAPITKTVGGFRISDIKAKASYPTNVLVHELMGILNPNNVVNPKELNAYLDFIDVPSVANFQIQTNPVYDYKLGKITFNIRMEHYYGNSEITNTVEIIPTLSEWIPISLILSPRLTTITTRTDYAKISVDKLKNEIFETNGVAKLSGITRFVDIKGAVEGAVLNLKPASLNINTGMGTANFTVFFDKYYAVDGTQKTQTANAITQSFNIRLQLFPKTTLISSKAIYTPTHRVDRFLSTFTDANGNVTNETILKQYIDLRNMPIGYTLKVSNFNITDQIAGTISFDVIASAYNDNNFLLQTNGAFPIKLLKLLPKYPTTDITAKAEGDYDDTVRLDRFITLFAPAAGGVVTDVDKLGGFLDLVSIPEAATVTVSNIVMTNATGKITFNVIVSQYYDVNSDLQTANKTFPVTLYLGIKYIPTEITANTNIVYPERIDRFETKINELSGTAELQAYLQTKYITIIGDLPKNTTFSVANIVSDLDTGIMNFDLIASDYYDENSDPQKDKTFALILGLRIKYAPTVLVAKSQADLGSERIDRFAHTIAMFTNQDLKNYLKDYVDGIKTLVVGSTLVASNIVKDDNTGIISFDLETNKYYDADSDFQAATKTWSLSLELTSKHVPTTIEAKTEDFTNIRVDSLIPSFTNDQLIVDDRDELNKYVTITVLPDDAQLSVKDANMTFSTGMILFKIVADKYYDGESDLVITYPQEFIIQLALGIKYQSTTVTSIKGYDQSVNVKTFAEQIKTLSEAELKTYLDTYIQTKGDISADAVMSVDADTVVYDEETGKVSFNVLLDKYYDADGSLQTNGSFTIKLKLAF